MLAFFRSVVMFVRVLFSPKDPPKGYHKVQGVLVPDVVWNSGPTMRRNLKRVVVEGGRVTKASEMDARRAQRLYDNLSMDLKRPATEDEFYEVYEREVSKGASRS